MKAKKKAQQWEYKIVSGSCSLHELGEQGWELVSVVETTGAYGKTYYYFKRPLFTETEEKIPQTRMEEMMQDAGDCVHDTSKSAREFARRIRKSVGKHSKCDSNRARINLNVKSDKSPVTLFSRFLAPFKR